ncbi:MAG: hypothetical protein ACT4RN_16185 [Pseudonocardia sp.]
MGLPAYLAPGAVAAVLPFGVPALHARLIGAMYLSGLAIQLGGLAARRWSHARLIPVATAIWTGGLLLVTVAHLGDFDLTRTQTQIWLGAYVAYPVIGVAILLRRRGEGSGDADGGAPATWARRCLTVQGAVLTTIALALLLAPGPVAAAWPWPVVPLLVQVYSAPLLAYGVTSLLLARVGTWPQMRVGVAGTALFAVLALVASLRHTELFTAGDPAALAWFGLLAALSALGVLLLVTRGGRRAGR